jgi:hypothetical protein
VSTPVRKQYHFRPCPDGLLTWEVDRLVGLARDGRVMDGMHRVGTALLEGHERIRAVRLMSDPTPAFIGRSPDDLPYS